MTGVLNYTTRTAQQLKFLLNDMQNEYLSLIFKHTLKKKSDSFFPSSSSDIPHPTTKKETW